MSNFYYYNGDGMLTDENGKEFVDYQMEVDDEQYPLTSTTTFTSYMDLKPPKKPLKVAKAKEGSSSINKAHSKEELDRTYRKYKKEDMNIFYFMVFDKSMSIHGAARELKIPPTTAQTWYQKRSRKPRKK
ncbi:MAG: hypothetical protein EXX96DRAFT_548597 [Benjaminiella poitrasii]|nr:MAG: hypothetical protein EXX96DRAFT_548597 [Benjaminiella poitrasii]